MRTIDTMRTIVDLNEQLLSAKTIGEMDEVRAQLDNLATEAAERGDSSAEALFQDAANAIRSIIYREIEKSNGMAENALLEQQRKHEAAIRLDHITRRTAKYLSTADDSEVELFNARMRKVVEGEDARPRVGWLAEHWKMLRSKIGRRSARQIP
jgi:hypothetical protein